MSTICQEFNDETIKLLILDYLSRNTRHYFINIINYVFEKLLDKNWRLDPSIPVPSVNQISDNIDTMEKEGIIVRDDDGIYSIPEV